MHANSPQTHRWRYSSVDRSQVRTHRSLIFKLDLFLTFDHRYPVQVSTLRSTLCSRHCPDMSYRCLNPVGHPAGSRSTRDSVEFTLRNGFPYSRLVAQDRCVVLWLYSTMNSLPWLQEVAIAYLMYQRIDFLIWRWSFPG